MAISGDEDLITTDFGGDDLADDVFVGEADDETVFGSIVFVLGLGDETFTGVVVSLPLAATLVLGLIAAKSLSVSAGCEELPDLYL